MYSSQTKYKVNDLRIKSPNKVNTDHHDGDLKFRFSPSVILLVRSSIMLNYHSIISLILTLLQCFLKLCSEFI